MKMGFLKRSLCLIAVLLAFCLAFSGCDLLGNSADEDFDPPLASNSADKQTQKPTSKPTDKPTEAITEESEEDSEGLAEPEDNIDVEPEDETVKESAGATEKPSVEVGEQRKAEKALGVPRFSGDPYFVLNNNLPEFTKEEMKNTESYEFYSELDSLGRCGYTEACIGKDIMPTEDRESISSVKPSGWVNNKYDTSLVDGGYIYNRCHLIGFQLTGENANKQNLITGTRYMNVDGMLPFENMIADYVKETNNHVMYRVTPIYDGNDLVACGVKLEAYSVEDGGDGIFFNVYVYNVQPGIVIDYATGNNWLSGEEIETSAPAEDKDDKGESKEFVLNINSKKIHYPTCSGANSMSAANRKEVTGNISDFIKDGYTPCGICKPAA